MAPVALTSRASFRGLHDRLESTNRSVVEMIVGTSEEAGSVLGLHTTKLNSTSTAEWKKMMRPTREAVAAVAGAEDESAWCSPSPYPSYS